VTHTDTTYEATRTPSWGRIALVSLLVAPLAVVVAGLVILAVAPGWAKTAPDGGNLLTLMLAGIGGGLIVARAARISGPARLFAPMIGGIVAFGVHELVVADTALDSSVPLTALLVYVPVQTTAYVLATWLPSRR
jgi:hypothetical protein